MIWEMLKKQVIIVTRNPVESQALLIVLLPMLLITILGLSLGGVIESKEMEINAKVALLEHEEEAVQVAQFVKEVENSLLPELEKERVIRAAEDFEIITLLKEVILDENEHFLELESISANVKERVLTDNSFAAMIEVPESFTLDVLRALLLNQGEAGQLKVHENKSKRLAADVVKEFVKDFEENIALSFYALSHQVDPRVLSIEREFGEKIQVGQHRSINSKEYYTVGMAVMNVLYIASMISYFAFMEKETHVFNRMIISNVSRWAYFFSIFLSGTLFAFVQLLLVYGYAWLVFKVSWPLLPFFLISFSMAMAVGGLSVFLTAVTYRINSAALLSLFGSLVIGFFALVGGSFFPVGEFLESIRIIGNFTPNGAGMTTYLNILRGEDLLENVAHLVFLITFTLLMIIIGVLSFPKRGHAT